MKNTIIVLLVCLMGLPVLATDPVSMKGEFVWKRTDENKKGDLHAEFTEVKEGEWKVSFHFTWEEKPLTYTGIAKGNLKNGNLTGEVKSDDKKHSYTFEGTVVDGKLTANHKYLREDGTAGDTGTLVLNPS